MKTTEELRAQLDHHEAFLRGSGDSVPPPPVLRAPEPISPKRIAEVGRVIQQHALLGAFGVTAAELAAFVEAAKRGAR
jgi:hypothetical protein